MSDEELRFFKRGAKAMLYYICFCVGDFKYRLNLSGIGRLLEALVRFREDFDLNPSEAKFRDTFGNISFREFYNKYK